MSIQPTGEVCADDVTVNASAMATVQKRERILNKQ
jgi:hypothetical protein